MAAARVCNGDKDATSGALYTFFLCSCINQHFSYLKLSNDVPAYDQPHDQHVRNTCPHPAMPQSDPVDLMCFPKWHLGIEDDVDFDKVVWS
jgi:hypothetical protein